MKARLAKLRAARATLSKLPSDEAAQLRAALRRSRRQKTTIEALRKDNARLRRTMRKLETRKAALEVQPAKLRAIRKALESGLAGLRAVRKTLSKSLSVADADLRRALRRSRRQKATIKSLSRENARLRKGAKTSRNRIETLEVQLERLRATGAVLSRALYGRKSEQQDKPGSERKRGQQRGAPGHGRTQRPGLDERTEEHNPPPDACVYRRETMELRTGDRIRWTRNDAGLGLVNSQTAEVTAVRDGRVSFRLEDGRMLGMNAADPQLRHIDRAWASTVHAFQGRTVDTVIAAIEANHPNLTNRKMLYVEISRARDRAELVTDDKAALKEQLEALTGERIAALEALGDGRSKAPEAAKAGGMDAEIGGERSAGRAAEPEKTPAPKSVDRDLGL